MPTHPASLPAEPPAVDAHDGTAASDAQAADPVTPVDEYRGPTPQQLRRISQVGWTLYAIWAAVLITWGIMVPDPYAEGWRLVIQLAFLGQAVNISYGVSNGFSNLYLLIQSATQDICLLLVAYPWIVRGYQRGVKKTFLGYWIERLHHAAGPYRRIVEPFGAIGLWVFVFFPFWSTGPLVGGVVGFLMGMRTRVIFASVFLGHFISVTTLIFLFDEVHETAQAFNATAAKFLPWIVLALLIALWILLRVAKAAYRRIGSRNGS